jgi:hypothetical protein
MTGTASSPKAERLLLDGGAEKRTVAQEQSDRQQGLERVKGIEPSS